MKDKKYVLTDETIEFYGTILYRIKAMKDFGDVKKGDLGGLKMKTICHKKVIVGFMTTLKF